MKKEFWVVVDIKTFDPQTQKQAKDRVIRWLETFGHTSSKHGFKFVSGAISEKEE